MRKIPKREYRELDNLSKFYKSLDNKGIHIDDELGSHSIVNLAKLVWKLNQNKDE
jgi:hypothetical protein